MSTPMPVHMGRMTDPITQLATRPVVRAGDTHRLGNIREMA